MAIKKTFHEIFTEVGNASKKADKIRVLHENSSKELKAVLGYTYDPNVEWLIPEGDPPYRPLEKSLDQEYGLAQESRKFYLFVKGITPAQRNLTQAKRESIYISMLESIDPDDAKVLLAMKTGKLPYKGLTQKLVAEAFPGISKNW